VQNILRGHVLSLVLLPLLDNGEGFSLDERAVINSFTDSHV
jgi:hypothetical protein